MAEDSWPNTPHNARAVTEAEYEQLVRAHYANGVLDEPSQTAVVYGDSSPGRIVKVRLGKRATARGFHWYSGTSDLSLSIAANAGATRLDLVVLRLDRDSSFVVTAAVVTGVSGSPAPTPTRGVGATGVYEIPLAVVTVANGASVIAAADVSYVAPYVGVPAVATANAAGLAYVQHKASQLVYQHSPLALYWDDGTTFRVLGEDSGWLLLDAGSVAAGWVWDSSAGLVVVYRKFNGTVHLQLRATRTGGSLAPNSGALIATLPVGFWPGADTDFVVLHSGPSLAAVVSVSKNNGRMTLNGSTSITGGASDTLYGSTSFPAGV